MSTPTVNGVRTFKCIELSSFPVLGIMHLLGHKMAGLNVLCISKVIYALAFRNINFRLHLVDDYGSVLITVIIVLILLYFYFDNK